MNYNKRRINYKIILIMLFLSLVFVGKTTSQFGSAVFSAPRQSETEQLEIKSKQKKQYEIANSLNLSDGLLSSVGFADDVVTVYNYVVAVRFLGEGTKMQDIWRFGKTYHQAFDEMYNYGEYSVNEYYRNITHGKLNLVSVIVNDDEPATVQNPRTNYLAQTANNPDGYDANNQLEDLLKRREILSVGFDDILTFLDTDQYRDKADYDSDGKIDSVSFMILPPASSQVPNPGWGHVLWPHQGAFPVSTLFQTGVSFQNSYGQTIQSNKYMFDYMEFGDRLAIDETMQTPSATTAIHELGHLVLNLPDLYVYDEAGLEYPDPVHYWDMMAYSHFQRAQYMTTYVREKARWGTNQGFLGESQVQEIKVNGDYTLQPVNYEETHNLPFSNDRVLAYKLVNPDNPKQSIYIEHRKQKEGFFDGNVNNLTSGLLIYLVDEGFSDESLKGNASGTPYNIFVYRGTINGSSGTAALARATINSDNRSVGEGAQYQLDGGRIYNSPNLFWQSYSTPVTQGSVSDLSYIDSGIVVKYKHENPQTEAITFTVEWDKLQEPPTYIEKEDFEDDSLYNTLLDIVGKTSTDKIKTDEFAEYDVIDLSNRGLTSISGFENLMFKNNAIIDLSNNNLSSLGTFEDYYKFGNNVVTLNLAFNNFTDISKIEELKAFSSVGGGFAMAAARFSGGGASVSRAMFAMQKPEFSYIAISPDNIFENSQQADLIYYNDYENYYTLNTNYNISTFVSGLNKVNVAGNFYFEFISKMDEYLKGRTFNISVSKLSLNNTFNTYEVYNQFDIENHIDIENINWNQISYQLLNSDNSPVNQQQIISTIGQKQIRFVSNNLKIEMLFEINVEDTESPVIELLSEEDTFVLKDSNFNMPNVKITDNYDQNLQWQTDNDLNNLQLGKNEIEIYALDSSNNMSNVVVVNIIILEIIVKQNIKLEVYDSFDYENAFTFLPNIYHNQFDVTVKDEVENSVLGLQTFKLNFTNIENSNIVFEVEGSVFVEDTQKPTIQLTSQDTVFIFRGNEVKLPVEINDNFDTELEAKTIEMFNAEIAGEYTLNVYAEDSSGNRSLKIVEVKVVVIDVVVSENYYIEVYSDIDYKNLVTIMPHIYADQIEYEIIKNATTNTLGKKEFALNMYYKNDANISQQVVSNITVQDTQPPVITFKYDESEIFLVAGSLYQDPELVVEDNYNFEHQIIITISGNVNTFNKGVYYRSYRAIDESGNISEELRQKITIMPKPIENLEIIKVSNIRVVTPNTMLTFKVNTDRSDVKSELGNITFGWFVNGQLVESSKSEVFEYSFKEMGEYEIEVRAETKDVQGNITYAPTNQKIEIVVGEGGFLDKYSLIVIVAISVTIIGLLIVSTIRRRKRKMFF